MEKTRVVPTVARHTLGYQPPPAVARASCGGCAEVLEQMSMNFSNESSRDDGFDGRDDEHFNGNVKEVNDDTRFARTQLHWYDEEPIAKNYRML